MPEQLAFGTQDTPGVLVIQPPYSENPALAPDYEEISSPDELRDPASVMQRLSEREWAFENDNTQYLAHDLHPYPAKFIPQLPGTLIGLLSLRGEVVLDPFGGSGTTALEAIRLQRRAISVDANPIASLVARSKTIRLTSTDQQDIRCVATALTSKLSSLPLDPADLLAEYAAFLPNIPNVEKWFPVTSRSELAMIRSLIEQVDTQPARDVCLVALSKIILQSSFQDSETRYASKPRDIPAGITLRKYLSSLRQVVNKVLASAAEVRYGQVEFYTRDARSLDHAALPDSSVEFIVTSPPYGNANDYHLYHRFRLFWLGYDPAQLSKIEIGSHLRHQKEHTGFQSYIEELQGPLGQMYRALNQDFHFGPGTTAVYTRAAPHTKSFRAAPCTSPPPVGPKARPSAHRR